MSARPALQADVLAQILEELRGIRRALERRSDGPAQADTELCIAIRRHVSDAVFSASELIEHARLPQFAVLEAAIVAAVGALNGRKLGQRLKRLEGIPIDGAEIMRVSSDRDGAVWRVLKK